MPTRSIPTVRELRARGRAEGCSEPSDEKRGRERLTKCAVLARARRAIRISTLLATREKRKPRAQVTVPRDARGAALRRLETRRSSGRPGAPVRSGIRAASLANARAKATGDGITGGKESAAPRRFAVEKTNAGREHAQGERRGTRERGGLERARRSGPRRARVADASSRSNARANARRRRTRATTDATLASFFRHPQPEKREPRDVRTVVGENFFSARATLPPPPRARDDALDADAPRAPERRNAAEANRRASPSRC